MKPNLRHEWAVTVYGPPAPTAPPHKTEWIEGDIQDALQAADELESDVEFEVHQFVITRRAPAISEGTA